MAQLVKNPLAMQETWVRSLGWEDPSPGEGKGYPLQYSGLENSMDCVVHGVAESRTRLSDFHFIFLKYIIYFCKSEVRPSIFISNMLSGDVESLTTF